MRDQQVTSLRPQIALDSDKSLSSETFQNTVLRPILKFQNELTLKLLTKRDQA